MDAWLEAKTRAKKILFLDDNHVLREMLMSRVLPAFNAEFIQAGTIAEAREILDSETILAAILDIRLINGSGIALYRDIAKKWPAMEVVFLSGYDSPDYRREIQAIGPARLFDKNRMSSFDFVEKLMAQFGVSRKGGSNSPFDGNKNPAPL